MPGYSGTPLVKKLGLTPPIEYFVPASPEAFGEWLGELPPGVILATVAELGRVGLVQKRVSAIFHCQDGARIEFSS